MKLNILCFTVLLCLYTLKVRTIWPFSSLSEKDSSNFNSTDQVNKEDIKDSAKEA